MNGFKFIALALSLTASAAQAEFKCIAVPDGYTSAARVAKLPGFGRASTREKSEAAALRSCKTRNLLNGEGCRITQCTGK